MTIRAVFFDVGETLIDETALWQGWADWLGIPRFTFIAMCGRFIERGEHPVRAFNALGFDLLAEYQKRVAAGSDEIFTASDLYPDAIPCLQALKQQGYFVGVAGNQPAGLEESVKRLGLPADFVGSSSSLDAEKPSPQFFINLAERTGFAPDECVSVGDRVDNDIVPAKDAGMRTVWLRRGPWMLTDGSGADAVIDDLSECSAALSLMAGISRASAEEHNG
ncbi:MAG: HAD family hydrolase [Actinomycetota bacterium]|nr:HAD family hydrolase [Actinomycetota bacterium]